MAETFMGIDDVNSKSVSMLIMSAYTEGRAAGKEEERKKWEKKTISGAKNDETST